MYSKKFSILSIFVNFYPSQTSGMKKNIKTPNIYDFGGDKQKQYSKSHHPISLLCLHKYALLRYVTTGYGLCYGLCYKNPSSSN